jgi:hypothetical protein
MLTIRFFSLSPMNSIVALQSELTGLGYLIRPVGTNALDILAVADAVPMRLMLASAQSELARQDIALFIEAIDPSASGALAVLNALTKTQTMIKLLAPDSVDQNVIVDVLDVCAALGQGLVQVDGEGFYEDGVLIFEEL